MPLPVRVSRTARVWRLTARNGARFALSKVRGAGASEARRAQLDQQFALRSAQDVAAELGNMKGALMKAGQLLGFIIEALPDDAQAALATLQADAPPMAPSLAEQVIREEFGKPADRLFLDWDPVPVAAASIGQVHRVVLHDGRVAAVKIQYPGVGDAIGADLDNAQLLYRMFSAFALQGLDTVALVDELRVRMVEELDYRREAANLLRFSAAFAGHPWVRTPVLVPEFSTGRVLTTEWIDGMSWAEFLATADRPAKQRAGEIIWRFTQGSIHRVGIFNGDPHPGNYRFHASGDVTFLDFGMVKEWAPGEWERLAPCMDAILATDPQRLITEMERVEFLRPGHGLDPATVADYVSTPYRPYLVDEFRFTREFVKDTVSRILDVRGPSAAAIKQLNLPVSFVVLDRVVWGVSALLGKLEAEGPWRAMLLAYRNGTSGGSPLGDEERAWLDKRASVTSGP